MDLAQISANLSNISIWMKENKPQLKISKTELLVTLANKSLHHNINIKTTFSTLSPAKVARNLCVMSEHKLTMLHLSPSCAILNYTA